MPGVKQRRANSVILNSSKLRTLHTRSGLTQTQVAERSSAGLRTVQRAFSGAPVQSYMAKRIAEALGATLPDLISDAGEATQQDRWAVLAWRCVGGMQLIRLVEQAAMSHVIIRVEAEPTPNTADDIAEIVSALESFCPMPDSPFTPFDGVPAKPGKVAQVRMAAELSERLQRLQGAGVCAYAASYVADDHEFFYDGDTFIWCQSRRSKNLKGAVVVIAADGGDRILVPVSNRALDDPAIKAWSPPETWNSVQESDDDFPF